MEPVFALNGQEGAPIGAAVAQGSDRTRSS
jgi:hypothetical protein